MGRGVYYPTDAEATVFSNLLCIDPAEDWEWEWDCLLDNIRSAMAIRYPSFEPCDHWIGNEGHVILENYHAQIVVSEYCGIAAVSLRASDDSMGKAWCRLIADGWTEVLEALVPEPLIRLGSMSNGETVYRRKDI